jgi:dTDP-4-dehydrorhamnose reductase
VSAVRILLLGKNGQVGWELHRCLQPLGEVIALGRGELDLERTADIPPMVREVAPEVIVNAAAYTDVDGAEREREKAHLINGVAPGVLAEEARRLGALLVHYSTDYVFDGEKGEPYAEQDAPNPINEYGRSKLEGERRIQEVGGRYLILRTSWVYSLRRDCFVTKVLRWARQREVLRIVDDQFGSPTWCRMLAEVTGYVLDRALNHGPALQGIYHVAGRGVASRYEWARAILQLTTGEGQTELAQIKKASLIEFPSPAPRGKHTGLLCEKLRQVFALRIPAWALSLELAMGDGGR